MNITLVPIAMSRRAVRPLGDWNQEQSVSFQLVLNRQNRGAVQVCAPGRCVRCWYEKHQMRMPVPGAVVQIPLL